MLNRRVTVEPAPLTPSTRSRHRIGAVATTAAIALGFSALVATPASAADPVTIAAVQGTGDASPLVGTTLTVEGIVTADYRGASGYNSLVIQTAGSGGADDATPGASDALNVFLGGTSTEAVVGDEVSVTGPVGEYYGLTQITAATTTVITSAAELAAEDVVEPAPLPDTAVGASREALENQLVAPTGTYRVASSFQLAGGGRNAYGTLWLSAGTDPIVKSTETTDAADPAAAQIAASNIAKRLLLDDGYSITTANSAHVGEQPYFTKDNPVRTGDTVVFPASPYVLSYGFNDWRLQPVVPITDASPAEYKPTFQQTNPRPATPPEVGGDFSVGAFNVLNYFTTLSSVNRAARGAATAAQFAIQRSKIITAINGLDADVVSLMEIENNVKLGEPADTALADLVSGLNTAAGSDVWAFVPTPTVLQDASITDFITSAIIYKKAVATPVGESFTVPIDESVWGNAREPIAQTFDIDGKIITAIANHFKSKSPPEDNTDPEPADGQGFFNAARVAQAASLNDFISSISADPAKSADVIALGDFNSYAEEDPIQTLTDAGMVDLIPERTDGQYTYEFNGELGSLDHAMATPSLAASITGAGVWAINSPEWSDRQYAFAQTEAGTPYRSSDHDPVKVGVSAAPVPVNIDIVSVNDFHGRLEAANPAAGAAVLGGMVDAYRAANPNTLFVTAGDSVGASTFTSFIQDDQPTIDALNAIGLDVSSLGNHEFDRGAADLDDRIIPAADFPYLAANIYDRGTENPAYEEYSVQEVDGVSVGFIGAVTEELPSLVSPAGIADLTVGPIVPAVNRVADQLSDGDDANGEADVVVLLVHEGASSADIATATDDSAFGRIATQSNANIDAIVSAHTHQTYNHEIQIPGTDRTRPVIQSGQYGEKFGHLNLSVDPETGALLSITSEVLPLFGAFPPNAEVAQIVADAVAVATVRGSVKVGDITGDLNRARQSDGTAENRGGESTLGNFVADVQKWATTENGSDLALMNPGGLRTDLTYAAKAATPGDGAGVVTYQEAASVQPFANTLVAMDLTTAQLKAVLEEQWQPAASSRPFLKLGVSDSLEYTYDPTAAKGDHIDAIYVDGKLATDADTYRVTVNSFLASGGDNFTTLASGTNRADTGKIDLQSMVDFFTEFPTVIPDHVQRAVGVTISPADADGYSAGDQVTMNLSSLTFSNGGAQGGTVTVSLGDTVLGTAEVDPTVVDTTDESGRATVTFTVPEGASGAQTLRIEGPEPNSEIGVPIEFAAAVEEPITNSAPPTITGEPRVGSTLTAAPGTWSVEGPAFAYQWNRAGQAITGATAATYLVTADDAGRAITVSVTASADGYTPASATSAPVTVAKATSSIYGGLNRFLSFGGSGVTYSATVTAQGATPTGVVSIYDGTRKIASATLEADDAGKVRVDLPRLGRGLHLITARYEGNGQLSASTAFPSIVFVF